jgi:alkylation response protein AidB-like acyl-CoA dehydrogenase
MTGTDPRAAARALRELIESEADAVEENNTMTPKVVDALVDSGLFRLLVPSDLGGIEADPTTIVDVCEELSFADGSVGWAFAQNTTVLGYAAYLAPEFAKPLAAARAGAGMFAPIGVAHKEEGGWRVSGSYPFGSGSGHAEFMGGSAMEMVNGEMPPFTSDLPHIRAFIVPAEKTSLEGNWNVMGLRGTGSFDFSVPEQFVEEGQTFPVFHHETITGGPIYGLGPIVLGTISSVAWSLGVARRALHEVSELAKVRVRMGALPLRDQPSFQRDLGFHSQAVRAARLHAAGAYERAVAAVAADAPREERDQLLRETKAAASYAPLVAKAAVTFAFEAAGSHALRNPSRLQRCFRDIYVGAAHQVFDERNFGEAIKPSLGLVPSPF